MRVRLLRHRIEEMLQSALHVGRRSARARLDGASHLGSHEEDRHGVALSADERPGHAQCVVHALRPIGGSFTMKRIFTGAPYRDAGYATVEE